MWWDCRCGEAVNVTPTVRQPRTDKSAGHRWLRGERLALYDRECQTTPLALAKEMHMDIPALTGHEVKDPGAVADQAQRGHQRAEQAQQAEPTSSANLYQRPRR